MNPRLLLVLLFVLVVAGAGIFLATREPAAPATRSKKPSPMTGFLNKAAFVWALSAGLALAQAQAPHATAPAFSDPQPELAEVAVTPEGTIHESTVGAPSVDGFGALDAAHGGLPQTVWAGSSREATDSLLKLFHGGIGDPALGQLVSQLLMTQATPPRGSAAQNWFSLRVQALIDRGADDKASQMLDALPVSMRDAAWQETQTGLALIRGEYDAACKQAAPAQAAEGDFWRKLATLCLARAGKHDEATVKLDLMREEGQADDAFFQEAIRRIGDKNAVVKSTPKQWTLLNVAALRIAADMDKIRERMDALPPVAVKYLGVDKTLEAKLHEKAAARAVQLGLMPVTEGNKPLEPPFSRPLASDVTTLVAALGSGKPANDADHAVIARLALDEGGLQDSRRVARLLTLMEPFGYKVPSETWQKLYRRPERFDGEMPPASLLARLNDAAQAHKRGETVLIAGLIIGSTNPGKTSDLVLLPVVRALQAAGFGEAARALAYDAVKDYNAIKQ